MTWPCDFGGWQNALTLSCHLLDSMAILPVTCWLLRLLSLSDAFLALHLEPGNTLEGAWTPFSSANCGPRGPHRPQCPEAHPASNAGWMKTSDKLTGFQSACTPPMSQETEGQPDRPPAWWQATLLTRLGCLRCYSFLLEFQKENGERDFSMLDTSWSLSNTGPLQRKEIKTTLTCLTLSHSLPHPFHNPSGLRASVLPFLYHTLYTIE